MHHHALFYVVLAMSMPGRHSNCILRPTVLAFNWK